MRAVICAALLLLAVVATYATMDRIVLSSTTNHPLAWNHVSDASPRERVRFTLHLRQRNLDKLSSTLERVSDPLSIEWGNFLTFEQINEMIAPSPAVFSRIRAWLAPFRRSVRIEEGADFVTVHTTVATASQLLQVPFATFKRAQRMVNAVKHVELLVRADGDVTLPADIAADVELLTGVTEFVVNADTKYRVQVHDARTGAEIGAATDPIVVPSLLRSYYGIPSDASGNNSKNVVGIAAFDDEYSIGALQFFEANQSEPQADVTRVGPDCSSQNCDEYESDLDVQYSTSIARGLQETFLAQAANGWILDFTNQVSQGGINPTPIIYSISYGWSELAQCEITTSCSSLGYNSQQYVTRTNTGLQKLGTAGITVLVSSGDDGAPSLGGASGNCPIDTELYCENGGCQYKTTQCAEFAVYNTNNNTGPVCVIPMGIGSDACADFLNNQAASDKAFQAFFNANTACQLNFDVDRSQLPHVHSLCTCDKLQTATSANWKLTQFTYNPSIPIFAPDYPTSSPYVLSVGATQFYVNTTGGLIEEVASIETGAIITSGGGFSAFQPQPSWQAAAVKQWAATAPNQPPAGSFNPSMRGYPDIAFNGHHYLIAASPTGSDTCGKKGCQMFPVDGTSCSSPTLAGMLSLINDQLLNAGYSQLGFVPPFIYQAASSCNGCIVDVMLGGSNRCNRAYCCLYGYFSGDGWDPSSGLGTPRFEHLLRYALEMKANQAAKIALLKASAAL